MSASGDGGAGPALSFELQARDASTAARAGLLTLPRGRVRTPAFMPVGTQATVKGLTPEMLRGAGARILLANTYHLMLRPGEPLIASFGGVSAFMGWHGPLLTDSGGYQIFSLADRRSLDADGVTFQSHIDGASVRLTPERAVEIQLALNADIFMALDICPPMDANRDAIAEAVRLTRLWAERSVRRKRAAEEAESGECGRENLSLLPPSRQSLFPIVQGGRHLDLRRESAEALVALDAPGYAIGGVSVGETPAEMEEVLRFTAPLLPDCKPRYAMGIGHPRDLLSAVAAGVDLFDCVLPTRNGRNAQAFTADGPVRLRNACHRDSRLPLDPDCDCYACRTVTRGYLHHLFRAGEMLASVLTSLHNVRFLVRLMEQARDAIGRERFASFAAEATARYEDGAAG